MSYPVRLWSDEPSAVDLLAFGAVAETAAEAVLDDLLDPVALGVSGPWGSGKSTVLRLIERELKLRNTTQQDQQVLVVNCDPWRYDPAVGSKAMLIGEVLSALAAELAKQGGTQEKAQSALKKLAKRVNWMKALKIAAKTSITFQLPGIDDLSKLVSDEVTEEPDSRSLDEFRDEFESLLKDDDLIHLRRVVVLVDDLDRCLPETVVDTLETIRLFLSVPKMSFVIAADEERVADALRERYPKSNNDVQGEEPAKLYLHKIVQTTLQLPALSRFDTEAFLLLLLLQNRPEKALSEDAFVAILSSCTELRTRAGTIDALAIPDGIDVADEMQFAERLTPMLYEKLRGSPRRVKRFLNDLNVRSSIASRRGIQLEIAIVAKLMILELLMPDEFKLVLDWLATGQLRQQLSELEGIAGRGESAGTTVEQVVPDSAGVSKPAKKSASSKVAPKGDSLKVKTELYSQNFIRWAKLPPSLGEIDLSPYLHLAASFTGTPLVDVGLPERLRDVAANLLSSSRASQKSVTDQDIAALSAADAQALVEHLGRMGRDRPTDLIRAVQSILRLAIHSGAENSARNALLSISVRDVKPPLVLLFGAKDVERFNTVLQQWSDNSEEQTVKNAVSNKLKTLVNG